MPEGQANQTQAPAAPSAPAPDLATNTSGTGSSNTLAASSSSKRAGLIVGGVVVVVLLAAGGVFWWLHSKTAAPVAAQQASRTVTIGLVEPLAGVNVSIGNDRRRGIEVARKDLNLQNVIIKVVEADSNCDAAASVPAVQKLIKDSHVVAIIGDECSSSTLAMSKVTGPAHVVLISPASTSPTLSSAGSFFFRTVPSDSAQGVFAANLLHTRGAKRLAIIHEDGAYGVGLSDSLKQSFAAAGGTVVDDQEFPQGATDVTTPMQHVKAQNPDAVYMISGDTGSDTALVLAYHSLGMTAGLYGSEAFKAAAWLQDIGDAANGLILTALPDGTKVFVDRYRADYGVAPNDYIANTADAFTALALAVKDGATTGDAISGALHASNFSFTGDSQTTIKFDKSGDVSGTYEPVIVQNKQFVDLNQ